MNTEILRIIITAHCWGMHNNKSEMFMIMGTHEYSRSTITSKSSDNYLIIVAPNE